MKSIAVCEMIMTEEIKRTKSDIYNSGSTLKVDSKGKN